MPQITLHFTREFIKGHLAGLRHNDSIGFFTRRDALLYVQGINARTGLNYKIVAYHIIWGQ